MSSVIKCTLDNNIDFFGIPKNVEIGKQIKVELTFYDKDDKELGKKSPQNVKVEKNSNKDKYGNFNEVISYKFKIKDLAQKLNIKSEDIAYVNGWMDIDGDDVKTLYDKEVRFEVIKPRVHLLFYVITGSKNDSLFIEQVNLKEKIIKESKNYNENIDKIHKKQVSKSSEILAFTKNKIEENGGKDKVEIKTVELFAELFKEIKKEKKDDISIDTNNHWINNMAQPYISNDTSIDEARNIINENVKRKEYLNKVYEENQKEFLRELKAGVIQGFKFSDQISTAVLVTTTGRVPFQITLLFAAVNSVSKYTVYKLENQKSEDFAIKLVFDNFVDIVAGSNIYMQISNELLFKPYFSYLYNEQREKDK
jgi:hypothetical protein